jgi:hypothetical protein
MASKRKPPELPMKVSKGEEVQAVIASQTQIEQTRKERIARHQDALKQGVMRAARGAPRRLNILAEGDSWFDYPFPLPFGRDTIDAIQDNAAVKPLILNLAHFGDLSTNMLGVAQRQRIVANLGNPANGHFDAMLFSAGGNDLIGDLFCLWLRQATPGLAPVYGVNRPRLAHIMGVVGAAYEDLAGIRDSIDPDVVLFVHAYDFAFPDGRPACPGVGPWLKPSLDLRGWTNPADATFIVSEILRAFDPMLVQFELDHPNVVYVRTQGTLRTKSNWANELHPTPGGFGKIANVFLAALAARFPGRI